MAKLFVTLLACGLLAAASAVPHKSLRLTHRNPRKSYDTMIVGGEDAEQGELPYQVTLQSGTSHFCGGSVANVNGQHVVITAAHCVDDNGRYSVVAGELSLSRNSGAEQRRTVSRIIVHEQYDYWTNENDIAILLIDQPFQFNDNVQAVTLPRQMQDTTGDIVVSGWGRLSSGGRLPDILQKVQIPVVDDAKCQRQYPDELIAPSMICAGLDAGGKDSCQGDSGGPLVAVNGGHLAGIVSWGYGCAAPGYPGVNTETSHFVDWINSKVSSL